MKKWLLAGLMLLSGVASAAIVQGKDYTLLNPAQPVANAKKVEVIEFFSYTCIHCYHLDQGMSAWAARKPADVDFKRVQIIWQQPMEGLARFFAAMNATHQAERLNHPAFVAVMDQHVNLGDEATLTNWLKGQKGVNVASFMQVYKSFAVNAEVARAAQMTRSYNIQGTPTIIVAGKYALQPAEPARLLEVLDEVVAKARKEMH